jgi:murein DD-endopeptidase MepM/ murein hydrolase activator NlpD
LKTLHILLTGLISTLLLAWPAQAQEGETTYIVQVGDTLTRIALKYNLSVTELALFNGLTNPDLIIAGQRLVIPDPTSLPDVSELEQTYTVQPGDTLFQIANRFGMRVARIAEANQISNVDLIEAGQTLIIPSAAEVKTDPPLPSPFEAITLSETTIIQGRTLIVSVALSTEANLTAYLEDRPLFLAGDGQNYWGIVGIHALSELGVYPVTFQAVRPDGTESTVSQNVVVVAGPYHTETIQVIPGRESLLDPELIRAEANKLRHIWSQVTPYKLWSGSFRFPVEPVRITSSFGTRRSYNGGPVSGFHGGTDFGGGTGAPIYAPATGVVVLAEPLTVRGNAVLINHGLGLFSGYWHQSELAVQVGDEVEPGDLIGYIGDTGLVTGPHLHWEMRLGGIAVEPLQWVEETIP